MPKWSEDVPDDYWKKRKEQEERDAAEAAAKAADGSKSELWLFLL